MDLNKILKMIVTIVIIGYLLIVSFPMFMKTFNDGKDLFDEYKNTYDNSLITRYIESRPDYYFKYEGAVYCIPVKELVINNILKEEDVKDNINNIIEASYSNSTFKYSYNLECEEK